MAPVGFVREDVHLGERTTAAREKDSGSPPLAITPSGLADTPAAGWETTRQEAVMRGPSIVGFGSYHYRYESGREADAAAVGFSSCKANLALYGPDAGHLLPQLGKHKTGVACLYINKLDDVDREVLAEMVRTGYGHVTAAPALTSARGTENPAAGDGNGVFVQFKAA
ncbi:DUF1801 domain-containing protein [Pseudarthrobacter sp. Y6]|uniref:DUF1801 domain-containing protein n=1 Tax=Pseudarthrobacter sp. Y6 TaxID=3418422 RepID=UPI003CF55C25